MSMLRPEYCPHGERMPSDVDASFFIPCYNEENNILRVIEKLAEASARLGLTYEILVWDDASQDRTAEVVEGYQKVHPDVPVRLFVNAVNRGPARNFVEGAFHARGEHYRLVCGDDVESMETILAILGRRGEADILIPYHASIGGRKLYRHLISRLYTFLVNLCAGQSLHYYNGCPLLRTYDVRRFHVEASGFGYQAEFVTRLLYEGRSYVEVPIIPEDREGSGALTFRNFLSVGHTLMKISFRRLRVYLFKW